MKRTYNGPVTDAAVSLFAAASGGILESALVQERRTQWKRNILES
jgi:hypothetical protein